MAVLTFLGIPLEVRYIIYHEILSNGAELGDESERPEKAGERIEVHTSPYHTKHSFLYPRTMTLLGSSLVQTCRQVHNEVRNMLVSEGRGHCHLDLMIMEPATTWVTWVKPPSCFNDIRYDLDINLRYFDTEVALDCPGVVGSGIHNWMTLIAQPLFHLTNQLINIGPLFLGSTTSKMNGMKLGIITINVSSYETYDKEYWTDDEEEYQLVPTRMIAYPARFARELEATGVLCDKISEIRLISDEAGLCYKIVVSRRDTDQKCLEKWAGKGYRWGATDTYVESERLKKEGQKSSFGGFQLYNRRYGTAVKLESCVKDSRRHGITDQPIAGQVNLAYEQPRGDALQHVEERKLNTDHHLDSIP